MSLTFGIGMHFCVGAHLARAELATALDVFLERFDDLALVEDAATRFVGSVLRGPDSLPVPLHAELSGHGAGPVDREWVAMVTSSSSATVWCFARLATGAASSTKLASCVTRPTTAIRSPRYTTYAPTVPRSSCNASMGP